MDIEEIAEKLAEALEKAIKDSDYCYACDNHPYSHGHSPGCPLVEYRERQED